MNIVTIDGIPVYQALVDSEDTGMLRISLVDDPAVQSDFLAFDADKRPLLYSVQDEEKRLVLGVVMRADFPIYRRDAKSGEFYVIYKADTIRTMAEKYLAENRQNLVNVMHKDGTEVDGVQMVQYFIKGRGLVPTGFENIADGSLFAEFHVTNDEVWSAIKEGTYRGFSLEGLFDLTPERNRSYVDEVVDALDGVFSRIFKNNKKYQAMKLKGLLARLAKALVEMGNITTDKGIIAWDGDEDLKAGDAVYIEDADGNRTTAEDGDYKTEDGKTIVVVDGKVSEIRDPEAEVATEGDAIVEAGSIDTDQGALEWNHEGDLVEGDEVFVRDEEGNQVAAPDGDYTTDDGKVITVVDGKVAGIADPNAEVASAELSRQRRIAQAFSESYDEKYRKIADAIFALGYEDFWVVSAGDDFAVAEVWDDERGDFYYLRFSVSWDEEGNAIVTDPVEVVPAFVTPEERDAADAAFSAALARATEAEKKVAKLEARLATLDKKPAGVSAHQAYEGNARTATGIAGKDRLVQMMSAK